MFANQLFQGDNLRVLREHIPTDSVDLVYLDPPHSPRVDYRLTWLEAARQPGFDAAAAMGETWSTGTAEHAADELKKVHRNAYRHIVCLRDLYGVTAATDYIALLALRLVEIRRVLRSTGSCYVHIPAGLSIYVRSLMDCILGSERFASNIIWRRQTGHNDTGAVQKRFPRSYDVITLYHGGDEPTWNQLYAPLDIDYIKRSYRNTEPGGRRFRVTPLTAPGGDSRGNPVYDWNGHTRAWRVSLQTMQELDSEGRLHYSRTGLVGKKLYLDESQGTPLSDVWDDVSSLGGSAAERLGYPGQKPTALLERLVRASSNPGQVVLDPYCGTGSMLVAAQNLGRSWIGIDIGGLPIVVTRQRLAAWRNADGLGVPYEVHGLPRSLDEVRRLARETPAEYEWWVLGELGASPNPLGPRGHRTRRVTGRCQWRTATGQSQTAVVLAASEARLTLAHLNRFAAAVAAEEAAVGVVVTVNPAPAAVLDRAAQAGVVQLDGLDALVPQLQVFSAQEVLDGQRPLLPPF